MLSGRPGVSGSGRQPDGNADPVVWQGLDVTAREVPPVARKHDREADEDGGEVDRRRSPEVVPGGEQLHHFSERISDRTSTEGTDGP